MLSRRMILTGPNQARVRTLQSSRPLPSHDRTFVRRCLSTLLGISASFRADIPKGATVMPYSVPRASAASLFVKAPNARCPDAPLETPDERARRRERRWMTSRRAMTAPHGRVRPDIAVVAAGTRDHPRAGSGAADTPARVPSCRHTPRTLGHRTHSTRHFQVDGAGPPSGWASGPPGGHLASDFWLLVTGFESDGLPTRGATAPPAPGGRSQGRPRTHVGPPAGAAERPETSANAVRFCVDVIAPVSKRPIWLVDAARSSIARPPTTQGIAGSRPSRSASFTSS